MYTASAVAEKAHVNPAEVRYFARKYNIPKITIENKQLFIFDKKEYRLFLLYKNICKEKKENKKQLHFSFYDNQKCVIQKQNIISRKDVQREKTLIKKLCALLQKAGSNGIDKNILQTALKIDKKQLENILNKNTSLPIAEDETIDNNLYWVGV
ncbi:hypothetical protein GWP43_04630 [Treponema vincentii]|uniref:Uncharacterized protein n=1 Tax=Treponema vincentii TaxID=69710 RepID=A0A6P1XZE6_9SPIR|nr:hypothetical protein [Treponema vincentii]QHX42847.1 hypothetical protein GWP43_04630 [Treponema vincentii]